jgi:hypothetical protein
MTDNVGLRLIYNVTPVALILVIYFGIINLSNFGFLSVGDVAFTLPVLNIIILVVLAAFFVLNTFIFGGPWAPVVYAVISVLVIQNWIVGVIIGLISLILMLIIQKIG